MNDDGRSGTDAPGRARLDEAIDRAVRRLMSVDPPAGLRRRVLARIERSRQPVGRLAFGRSAWVNFSYATAAVLAVVLIAVLVFRDVPPPTSVADRTTVVAPAGGSAANAPSGFPATPREARSRMPRRPAAQTPAQPLPDRRISAASLPDDDVAPALPAAAEAAAPPQIRAMAAVPPLKALAPIEVAPLVIEPLRIDPIPPRR